MENSPQPPHPSMNDNVTVQHHHHRIDDEDNDGVDCSNGNDSMDNPPFQIRYDPSNASHLPHALAGGGGGGGGGVIDAVGPPSLYVSHIPPSTAPSAGEGGADQLTLSFQGEVYIFDLVSPEKVQAVLLLLGDFHRNLVDYPRRSSQPRRAASLNRFREKRKETCFEKKIRYTGRK